MRYGNWKSVFCEQRRARQLRRLGESLHLPALPKMFNLRMDPYEHADISRDQYDDWRIEERLPDRDGAA